MGRNVNPAEQVIRQKFQQYYLDPKRQLDPPPNPSEREYGFLLFNGKFMVRHRSFKDPTSLLTAVRDLVPSHVYFSTAYYREPTAPMEQKGWIGADLVFDIDADHLNTPCKPDQRRRNKSRRRTTNRPARLERTNSCWNIRHSRKRDRPDRPHLKSSQRPEVLGQRGSPQETVLELREGRRNVHLEDPRIKSCREKIGQNRLCCYNRYSQTH